MCFSDFFFTSLKYDMLLKTNIPKSQNRPMKKQNKATPLTPRAQTERDNSLTVVNLLVAVPTQI